MLKISEAASLALHTASLLAIKPKEKMTTGQIAYRFNVSEAHLSKVLQRLAKHNLVKSNRGPSGGFMLNQPATQITLLAIYEAIEGPFKWEKCLLGRDTCPVGHCLLGDMLEIVNERFFDYMSKTSLADAANLFKLFGAVPKLS
ncbi:MAG: Rrf2 family transcriptional regulator [bacterium]|nr:Rrf2 family transcriptional regulator [bacterium]